MHQSENYRFGFLPLRNGEVSPQQKHLEFFVRGMGSNIVNLYIAKGLVELRKRDMSLNKTPNAFEALPPNEIGIYLEKIQQMSPHEAVATVLATRDVRGSHLRRGHPAETPVPFSTHNLAKYHLPTLEITQFVSENQNGFQLAQTVPIQQFELLVNVQIGLAQQLVEQNKTLFDMFGKAEFGKSTDAVVTRLRAMELLAHLVNDPNFTGLSQTELGQQTGLTKNSAHIYPLRIIERMCEQQFIFQFANESLHRRTITLTQDAKETIRPYLEAVQQIERGIYDSPHITRYTTRAEQANPTLLLLADLQNRTESQLPSSSIEKIILESLPMQTGKTIEELRLLVKQELGMPKLPNEKTIIRYLNRLQSVGIVKLVGNNSPRTVPTAPNRYIIEQSQIDIPVTRLSAETIQSYTQDFRKQNYIDNLRTYAKSVLQVDTKKPDDLLGWYGKNKNLFLQVTEQGDVEYCFYGKSDNDITRHILRLTATNDVTVIYIDSAGERVEARSFSSQFTELSAEEFKIVESFLTRLG